MNYDNITKEKFNDYLNDFNNSLFNIDCFIFYNENEDNNEINFDIDYEDIDPEIIELYELKKKGISFKEDLKTAFNLFDIRLKKLIKFSHDNDVFFDYCTSIVYENTFENRYKLYQNKFIDVQKIDFILRELNIVANKRILGFNLFSYENQTILNNSYNKKIEFLKSISKDYKINIVKKTEFDLSNLFNFNKYKIEIENNQTLQINTNVLDLSDAKAIDKILYLHSLGIIDFLRLKQPFNTSINSIATILSAITGEKVITLQPYLNPMLSNKVDEKNNPLNSTKAVERVKNKLNDIGFNLNETN